MLRFYIIILIAGLFVYGCGTPNDPDEVISGTGGYNIISKFATTAYAQDIIVEDTLAYIAQGEGGLLILSVANPAAPYEITTVDSLKGYLYKLAKKDSAVYIAASNFGLSVVNVSDPANAKVEETNWGPRPARDLVIYKDFLLTSISELGVNFSKIEILTHPDQRDNLITPGYARGMCVTPDSNYLLVACGEMGLTLMNISNLQTGYEIIKQAGWIDTRGYAMDVTCHPDSAYAYLACGTGGLVIVDYSDTTAFKVVGSYSTGGYAKEIEYKDNKIYLTTETRGLQVFDVSDVTNPLKIGAVNTKYALGIYLTDDHIYIADEVEGMIVISYP